MYRVKFTYYSAQVGLGLSHTEGALCWGVLGWACAPLLLLLQPAVLLFRYTAHISLLHTASDMTGQFEQFKR